MVAAFRSLVLVVCSLLFVAPVLAQQQASISGKLVDPDGLVLPGATVTVTEQNTGFSRNVVTAETGAYTVPNLTPGTYTVTVEMPGFGSLKRTDVLLTAGRRRTEPVEEQSSNASAPWDRVIHHPRAAVQRHAA